MCLDMKYLSSIAFEIPRVESKKVLMGSLLILWLRLKIRFVIVESVKNM